MKVWRLTPEQEAAVQRTVVGRLVHDFGAGNLVFARLLAEYGAREIVAVEKEPYGRPMKATMGRVQLRRMLFADFLRLNEPLDVGVVSWPLNRSDLDLLQLIERCKTVIYLGSNTDCNQCGGKELLQHFLNRPVIEYVPDRSNTLLVLGEVAPLPHPHRLPTGEELAGLLSWVGGQAFTYEQAIAMCPYMEAKRILR
jgi:hypothetical protein